MKRAQLVGVVVAAAILAVVVWAWMRSRHGTGTGTGSGSGSGSATASAPASGSGSGSGSDPDPESGSDDPRYRVIDSDARSALLQRIADARAARQAHKPVPATAAPAAGDPPALPGELTADQILDGIMPIMPLLKECYQDGLDRRTITSGQVTFTMHLAGEPEIGTLVDHAELGGDPKFLADADLAECLQETMMSVELPPMKDGAELDATVKMQFSPDGEPPDAGSGSP